MSMLKHVLTFFAFIMVSLATVSADEGYIPFFPDFLEPDGIGYRGPSEISKNDCWSNGNCDFEKHDQTGTTYSWGQWSSRAFPITLEFRNNYIWKNFLYTNSFIDIIQTRTIGQLNHKNSSYYIDQINQDNYLNNFFTEKEKLILSGLDNSYIFNLSTKSNYLLTGVRLGLDLWIFEFSLGPYIMYHNTNVKLETCNDSISDLGKFQEKCSKNSESIIDLDSKTYSGLGLGYSHHLSIILIQTKNWRVSWETSVSKVLFIYDQNFNRLQYRGLNFFTEFKSYSWYNCSRDGSSCINSDGEDLSTDYNQLYGLQLTYFFR